jgi:hypothetical protein
LRTTHIDFGSAAVQADFLAAVLGNSAFVGRHPSRLRFEVLLDIELNHSCHNSPPLCGFLTSSFVPGRLTLALKSNVRAKPIDL